MTAQPTARPRRRRRFAERLVQGLAQTMARALDAESIGLRQGFLHGFDPRIKLIGVLALIVSGVLTHSLVVLTGLLALALLLALTSHLTTNRLFKQVWISVLIFSGVIALPAVVLVPGDPLCQLPLAGWPITEQGVRSAAFLIGRAETSATLALLLVTTTPWPHVLKAMRTLGVPVVLVAILGMTHRYLFLLLQTAMQLFEARRSRLIAPIPGAPQRRMATATAGVLLGKAFQLSSEVHLAMISRGYRGEVHLLHEFRTRPRDWLALCFALAAPITILWLQR